MEIALRVLVSLSHENTECCSALLLQPFTMPLILRTILKSHNERQQSVSTSKRRKHDQTALQAEDDGDAHILDRLCLALGLLTNLIQMAEDAKDISRETGKSLSICIFITIPNFVTEINPTCVGKRNCIRGCQCEHRVSALACLSLVYIQQGKATSDLENVVDPGADFLRGHLAVLFGLLMCHNPANQTILLAALPGTSHRSKLATLVDQALDFVTFYAELTGRLVTAAATEDGKENEGFDVMAIPPQRQDYSVKRIVRDGKGEDVAHSVILFLETLRDGEPPQ